MKRVLKRDFYGADGKLYKRANAHGDVLVHDFPDDMKIPSTAMTVEEAMKKGPVTEPLPEEPTTLRAMQKQGRKPTSLEKQAADANAALEGKATAAKAADEKQANESKGLTNKQT